MNRNNLLLCLAAATTLATVSEAQPSGGKKKAAASAAYESPVPPPVPDAPVPPVPPKQIFTYVDRMPEFPGDLARYMKDHLHYPETARNAGIEGKVVVRFAINELGEVKDAMVARPVNDDLDTEALRLVQGMPRWKPGMKEGKPVTVQYSLPVKFQL